MEDCGLQLKHHARVFPDGDRGERADAAPVQVFDYFQVSSRELLLADYLVEAIVDSLGTERSQRMMTYLANGLSKVELTGHELDRRTRGSSIFSPGWFDNQLLDDSKQVLPPIGRIVPYSIVVGVTPNSDLDLTEHIDVSDRQLRLPCGWINSWLAEQLDVRPGEWIQLQYYEPETVDGELTQLQIRLMVAGIVPLVEPEQAYTRTRPAQFSQPPTIFNDPDLTPTVPGITDQQSIANWDVPFELELRDLILEQDDRYWENHRLTPKLFLPIHYAERLFRSRFGATTAIRVSAASVEDEERSVRPWKRDCCKSASSWASSSNHFGNSSCGRLPGPRHSMGCFCRSVCSSSRLPCYWWRCCSSWGCNNARHSWECYWPKVFLVVRSDD